MVDLEREEFEHVCSVLQKYGIIVYFPDGEMKPFNRVMIEIAEFLRKEAYNNPASFLLTKTYIMETIVGKRFVNFI